MSNFMEIHLGASEEATLSLLSQEVGGAMQLKPFSQDNLGWSADWQFGVFCIRKLDQEDQEELQKNFGLPLSLRTRLWITTQPFDDGMVGVYGLASRVLRAWSGDLAVLLNGDYLRLQRVNNQIKMRLDCLSEDIYALFDGLSCQPLPIPPDDAVREENAQATPPNENQN